jgi:hypothetical protein
VLLLERAVALQAALIKIGVPLIVFCAAHRDGVPGVNAPPTYWKAASTAIAINRQKDRNTRFIVFSEDSVVGRKEGGT